MAPDQQLVWACQAMNGAQDVAVLTRIDYWVKFSAAAKADGAMDSARWGTCHDVVTMLTARGLKDGEDFSLQLISPGRPIPAQGLMFIGWFTEKAMAEIDDVSICVQVADRVGDTHERVMDLLKGAIRSPKNPSASPF
ncbi:hypothetical protein ACFWNL_36660 [Kitasatospora sp. NPDC058397]|uniref:hypothetical protein n=1 Tax=unclassified Kitasatospora TaxID=2633591 RepID=UPI00365893CC